MNPFEQLFANLAGKILLGQLRHWVTVFGAGLATQGYWTNDQANQAEGAIMVLIPLALSAYDKWKAQQTTNAAIVTATVKGAQTTTNFKP